MMPLCSVLTGYAPEPFTYTIAHTPPTCGNFVRVPLRGRNFVGVVWDNPPLTSLSQIKEASLLPHIAPLQPPLIQYIKRSCSYTMSSLGQMLRLVVPSQDAFQETTKVSTPKTILTDELLLNQPTQKFTLNPQQQLASNAINQQIQSRIFAVSVLKGVTGSGKTEAFFTSAACALSQKRQALILLPEIMLAEQIFLRAQTFFQTKVALWHSDLPAAQRNRLWREWQSGAVSVLIGTRSALHLPTNALGLIVVDEEHDNGYKQEEGGAIYHARDLAVLRGQCEGVPVVLSSATPSLETLHNLQHHRHYQQILLEKRFGTAQLPKTTILDTSEPRICSPQNILSLPLQKAITENLEKQQQTLLFFNRRGFAPVVTCSQCNTPLYCRDDGHVLAYHLATNTKNLYAKKEETIQKLPPQTSLLCHICGKKENLPATCPVCKCKSSFVPRGWGVERIAEEIAELLPTARIAVATSDTLRTRKQLSEFLHHMTSRQIDIVIGTQLVAKGLNFPHLSLVGVINALQNANSTDFRHSERCVQVIQQVVGRAGRHQNIKGKVIIQHNNAASPLAQFLYHMDKPDAFDSFVSQELESRKICEQPPYALYLALIASSPRQLPLQQFCRQVYHDAPNLPHFTVFPPIPAPIPFLRSRHRMRFLVKSTRPHHPQQIVKKWLAQRSVPHHIRLQIDVDPFSFF